MVATQIFIDFHPEPWGDDFQFDKHIFQRGWFNHQLAMDFCWVFLDDFFGAVFDGNDYIIILFWMG